MKPQLQVGHWYLVHNGDGHASIRAYMHDGWYPLEPHPTDVVCEMSRSDHPDNVSVDEDSIVVSELDKILIEKYCPAAAEEPLVARAVRGTAEMFALANWQDWDQNWTWDPKTDGELFSNHHARYLAIAAGWVADIGGSNPQVRDMDEVLAVKGQPLGWFRPKRWPAEELPGAVQLLLRAS